jgi:hypothetical protein
MKAIFIITLLSVLSSSIVIGQRNLTKDEIFQSEIKSNKYRQLPKDSIRFSWDEAINDKIHHLLDSLQSQKIDSLIVYSIAYPGYSGKLDPCISSYPNSTYIIWKNNGLIDLLRLNGKCQSEAIRIKQDSIFSFYNSNYQELKKEEFMPIILGARIIDSVIRVSMSHTSHEPKYILFYEMGEYHKKFDFTESDLEDKKSFFHDDNLSLKAYYWWQIISRLAGE